MLLTQDHAQNAALGVISKVVIEELRNLQEFLEPKQVNNCLS